MKHLLLFLVLIFSLSNSFAQGPPLDGGPWKRPLIICESNDGATFTNCHVFQDSSGVPNVIRWKGDTLIAAFQWFPFPQLNNPAWDKVAVKFSYDGGTTWEDPTSIVVNGLPGNYQRPFDPTLYALNSDSIRIYFSSGPGTMFLDSNITTYSAISTDGINYTFEPGERFVSNDTGAVIDPAVIRYKGMFHFQSHIGRPEDGSYHGISQDGLNFTRVQNITSDNNHSWLGNYVIVDTMLRFYGNGPQGIWFNNSSNGGVWNGYTNTNITGGDPSVVQNLAGHFYIVYTGEPYLTGMHELSNDSGFRIYSNPVADDLELTGLKAGEEISIYDLNGRILFKKIISGQHDKINLEGLQSGIYFIKEANTTRQFTKQ